MAIEGCGDALAPDTAFVDESFQSVVGSYVLGCVVVPAGRSDDVRDLLRRLAGGPGRRIHWRDRTEAARLDLVDVLAGQRLAMSAWVTTVERDKQQERARRLLLERVVFDLGPQESVRSLVLETRHDERNARDREALSAFRRSGLLRASLSVSHGVPLEEPLLWVADVVAGAVGVARRGSPRARDVLGSWGDLTVTEVPFR